ncbi:MAG: hypothetical protein FWC13_12520 [Oscillospiraceae bacterium]|nr:hypothetical protein [Oscillospiraceae bacterium]
MKFKRIISIVLILMLSVSLASVAFATNETRDVNLVNEDVFGNLCPEKVANAIVINMAEIPYVIGDGYIDFELNLDELFAGIEPLFTGTTTGNAPMLNAFFNPGQRFAESNIVIFDWLGFNTIPWYARVTDVQLTSQVTTVQGVSYWPRIYWRDDNGRWDYREFRWEPTIRTNWFNGLWARTMWALDFAAERIIIGQDFGAGATMRSASLRVTWRS